MLKQIKMKPNKQFNLKYCFVCLIIIVSSSIYLVNTYEYIGFSKHMNENIVPSSSYTYESTPTNPSESSEQVKPELKYILQWTAPDTTPFKYMGVGQQGFIDRKCRYTNCFVTSNKTLLGDYTQFDVIAFHGPEVKYYEKNQLPQKRSPHQKYVFASIESSANYPIKSVYLDNFFNWTWTYKLDSDLRWGYMVVRDAKDNIIGPNKIMHWMRHKHMLPASEELTMLLRAKKKAVVWLVSSCHAINKRENYVATLNYVLQSQYNLSVDIYGMCGELTCKHCEEMIKRDYLFYLSFENSNSEDYVTEKLVRAMKYNAIPIVYGGANYSRFLSEVSYIQARPCEEDVIAAKINELVNDFDQYVEYFRWTNHYKYQHKNDTADTSEYCGMCALLNDESKVKKVSVYKSFRKWWNT